MGSTFNVNALRAKKGENCISIDIYAYGQKKNRKLND
jgi:hypothetical protein